MRVKEKGYEREREKEREKEKYRSFIEMRIFY